MKKILVAGATGFIGSELVRQLILKGYRVRCLVRKNSKTNKINFKGIEFSFGDVTDKQSIKNICEGVDIVFHLAGIGDINAVSKKHYIEYKKVNVDGTKNIFRESLNSGVKKFFHFSSMAAMGNVNKRKISPLDPCSPELPYGITKYESEQIFSKIRKETKIKTFVIRPCMVYDWIEDDEKEASKIMKMVKRGVVFIPGNGNNLLNIINRKSLVKRLINMMKEDVKAGTYIMVDETITFNEFIQRVVNQYKIKNVRIFHLPKILIYRPIQLIEYLAKVFGFKPVMTTERLDNIFSSEH
jgi:nucleoside-diphosphate-sugar epimerase